MSQDQNKMKPFKDLITYARAMEMIMNQTMEIKGVERIDIEDGNGRILSSHVIAGDDVPGFFRAAMDGYAVMASDTLGASRTSPLPLKLAGKIFAGQKPDVILEAGNCIQIATGAPMPEGADAVVMVEETSLDPPLVKIFKPVYAGANVSAPDSDIKKGQEILKAGTELNPPKIGVMAALGLREVEVFSRPRVSIFPTGEELVTPGGELDTGRIFDINSYTLASLLSANGADITIHELTGDSEEELKACLDKARSSDHAIFSGGSSVGERDLLAKVLAEEGEVIFHGIALKPGKPTIFGKVGSTLVFGMPGYPTSCLTNAYSLLVPSIRKMARLPSGQRSERAVLGERIVSTIGRHHLYTVKLERRNEDGRECNIAHPVFKESGAITSMSEASGWIEIPQNTEFLEKGTEVVVRLF